MPGTGSRLLPPPAVANLAARRHHAVLQAPGGDCLPSRHPGGPQRRSRAPPTPACRCPGPMQPSYSRHASRSDIAVARPRAAGPAGKPASEDPLSRTSESLASSMLAGADQQRVEPWHGLGPHPMTAAALAIQGCSSTQPRRLEPFGLGCAAPGLHRGGASCQACLCLRRGCSRPRHPACKLPRFWRPDKALVDRDGDKRRRRGRAAEGPESGESPGG